jgi:hypothetical protein
MQGPTASKIMNDWELNSKIHKLYYNTTQNASTCIYSFCTTLFCACGWNNVVHTTTCTSTPGEWD